MSPFLLSLFGVFDPIHSCEEDPPDSLFCPLREDVSGEGGSLYWWFFPFPWKGWEALWVSFAISNTAEIFKYVTHTRIMMIILLWRFYNCVSNALFFSGNARVVLLVLVAHTAFLFVIILNCICDFPANLWVHLAVAVPVWELCRSVSELTKAQVIQVFCEMPLFAFPPISFSAHSRNLGRNILGSVCTCTESRVWYALGCWCWQFYQMILPGICTMAQAQGAPQKSWKISHIK